MGKRLLRNSVKLFSTSKTGKGTQISRAVISAVLTVPAAASDIVELRLHDGALDDPSIAESFQSPEAPRTSPAQRALHYLHRLVEAKRGNPLTDAEADDLIGRARAIIDAINDGTINC